MLDVISPMCTIADGPATDICAVVPLGRQRDVDDTTALLRTSATKIALIRVIVVMSTRPRLEHCGNGADKHIVR